MALYTHFATKDELVDGLLDRVLQRFEPPRATGEWVTDLAALARAHRQLLVRHPWAVAPLFTHPDPGGPAAAQLGDFGSDAHYELVLAALLRGLAG